MLLGSPWPNGALRTVIFGAIFALGAGLFLYNFTFFKFATDEPYGMLMGDIALDNNFLIGHGRGSAATSIFFGPYFAYLMGAIVWLTHDPRYVMLTITIINIVGILLAIIYLARTLPAIYAVGATLLLSVSPGLILNANRLWEPAPIFPFVVLFHIALYRFLKQGTPLSFVTACALAAIISQFHLSGFFLFPLLALIAFLYRKLLGIRWLAASGAAVLLFVLPYALFMLSGDGWKIIVDYLAPTDEIAVSKPDLAFIDYLQQSVITPAWRMLDMNFGASSIYFFKYVFGKHLFKYAMEWYSGPLASPLYWLSMTIGFSFLVGWGAYLVWVIRHRSFFSNDDEQSVFYPLPFQISGFMVTGVIFTYLILRIPTWPHYFQTLYPCYAILSAWPLWRLWRFISMRILVSLCLVAHIALVFILLSGVKTSGAAPSYRATYETQEKIRDAVWEATPKGKVPQIYLQSKIYVLAAIYSMVGWENAIGDLPREPIAVVIEWDPYSFKAIWSVKNIGQEINKRVGLLKRAVKIIPDGSSVLADDSFNSDLDQVRAEVVRFMPLADISVSDQRIRSAWLKSTALAEGSIDHNTPYQLLKGRTNVSPYHGRALPDNAGDFEYIFLNLYDPRKLNLRKNRWEIIALQKMLQEKSYGLLYQEGGVFIFKRGLDKKLDAKYFREYIFSYQVMHLPRQTGLNSLLSLRPRREVRVASDKVGGPGFLSFGPYIKLPKGEYQAFFDIRIENNQNKPILDLDVTGLGGSRILAKKEVSNDKGGQWQTVLLPFTVDQEGMEKIEFRVLFKGGGTVSFEKIRLEMSDQQIEAYIRGL